MPLISCLAGSGEGNEEGVHGGEAHRQQRKQGVRPEGVRDSRSEVPGDVRRRW